MNRWLRENELAVLVLGWLAIAAAWVGLALTAAGPGMLYDEAWLAQQGRAFVEPLREGLMPPGTQKTWLLGRPFPLFALPYLGSLKSQLLIPSLALFGNELATVRLTTLAIALAALLATMLAARRIFDLRVALLCAALIATDPTIFFHAQWEWGPFTTGWLCRAVGAALLLRGYALERRGATLAGSFALGLGIYNRADFVLIGAATLLGLALFHGAALRDVWNRRRGELAAATALLCMGALPMLLNAGRVFGGMGQLTNRGDFAERVNTLLSTLDGSYPHRLMSVGGRYETMASVDGPITLLGVAAVVALVACGVEAARHDRTALSDGRGAIAVATAGIAVAMLALPGATRAHHMLNLAPFVHLLVAAQLVREADRRSVRRGAAAIAAIAGIAVLASGAASIASTRSLIERTGGRGWWRDAIAGLASDLDADDIVVSLDWGFHLQLLFSTTQPRVIEPFWRIATDLEMVGAWSHLGSPSTLYLIHDRPYDRFGYGPRFLQAMDALGEDARTRVHRDREGEPAFYSVRIARPHRLLLDRRGFRVEF